jgi:hypothetical protein
MSAACGACGALGLAISVPDEFMKKKLDILR